MSDKATYEKQAETMSLTNDDDTEFSLSKSPRRKRTVTFEDLPPPKEISSDDISPDGLHFKSNDQLNTDMEDHLSFLFKQGAERQAKQIQEKRLSETFEFDEHIPPTNMSFFDRLFHQITRPKSPEVDDFDDVFIEVDQSEITTAVNDKKELKDQSSFMNSIRLFISDLNEETNVIRGIVDEDEFLNRQSLKAKSSLSSTEDDQTTAF